MGNNATRTLILQSYNLWGAQEAQLALPYKKLGTVYRNMFYCMKHLGMNISRGKPRL